MVWHLYRWDVYVLTWDHIESQIGDYSPRMKCHFGHFELYIHFNTFTYLYNKPLHHRKLTWDPPKKLKVWRFIVMFRFKKCEKSRGGTNFTDLYNEKETVQRCLFKANWLWLLSSGQVGGGLVQNLVLESNPFFPRCLHGTGDYLKVTLKTHKI